MKKRIFSIIIYSFLLGGIFFLIYIFYPRKYDVLPHRKLANTKYWTMSTGSRIGYVLIDAKGQTKSYPIIYLHGGPGGVITEEIVKMLTPFSEDGYDIYAYDQIGSGSSERLDNIGKYTVERHQADLEEIVGKIEAEKVILLGQSWGSVLATFFAIDHPNKVDKMIMTGPGPVFPINGSLADVVAPDSLGIKEPQYSNQDANREVYTLRDKCIRWYTYVTGRKLISDGEVDDFFTHLNSALNKSTLYDPSLVKESSGGGGYYAHLMTFKSLMNIEDPRERMKKLKIPILIMKGQYDNQKWGFTREYVDLCERATLKVIPKAGHFIHVEQPEIYYQEIKNFLMR